MKKTKEEKKEELLTFDATTITFLLVMLLAIMVAFWAVVSYSSHSISSENYQGRGAYGSTTNPIDYGNWSTPVGINYWGMGYYKMPGEWSMSIPRSSL